VALLPPAKGPSILKMNHQTIIAITSGFAVLLGILVIRKLLC
jgi:hypothetical protein